MKSTNTDESICISIFTVGIHRTESNKVPHRDTCKHHGKKNNVNYDHTNTTVHLIRAKLSAKINSIRITDTR